MTAREMTPEQLAEVRAWLRGELDPMVDSPPSMGDEDWTDAVFAHADTITADRDEARAEVAALRAQRDEIREAHRVEVAALTERLEAAERERDEERRNGVHLYGNGVHLCGEVVALKTKLAALVEACDHDEAVFTRWLRDEPGVTDATLAEAEAALGAALRAAWEVK